MPAPDTTHPPATCACGAPGQVRVVDPAGAYNMCALHAIALIGAGRTRVTLVLDTAPVPT